jgi:hypothetical protein
VAACPDSHTGAYLAGVLPPPAARPKRQKAAVE